MVKVSFYAGINSFSPFKNDLYVRRNEFSSFKWRFYSHKDYLCPFFLEKNVEEWPLQYEIVNRDSGKSCFKFELNVETGKITYL